MEYIARYNGTRLHSSLGYRPATAAGTARILLGGLTCECNLGGVCQGYAAVTTSSNSSPAGP